MTRCGIQLSIPGLDNPTHGTGGITGGEGTEYFTTPEVDIVIMRDPRRWGPITEPEVFWAHFLKHGEDYLAEVEAKWPTVGEASETGFQLEARAVPSSR